MKYMIRRMLALVFVLLLSMAAIVPAEEPANEHVMGEGGITGDAFAEDEIAEDGFTEDEFTEDEFTEDEITEDDFPEDGFIEDEFIQYLIADDLETAEASAWLLPENDPGASNGPTDEDALIEDEESLSEDLCEENNVLLSADPGDVGEGDQHTLTVSLSGVDDVDGIIQFKMSVDGEAEPNIIWLFDHNSKSYSYDHGTEITLEAGDLDGCVFANWTENGKIVGTEQTISLTLDRDCDLTANYYRHGIMVKVDLEGREWEEGDSFAFKLTPVDNAPLPRWSNTDATVRSGSPDHSESFGTIRFNVSDVGKTFTYKVTQVPGEIDDITYDTEEKTVTITVNEAEGGGTIELTPSPVQILTFTNVYEPDPIAPTITEQPADLSLTYGYTDGNMLSVNVEESKEQTYEYQWYSNDTASNENGTKIDGAAYASYTVPAGKPAGTEDYYYCEVTAIRGRKKTATVSKAARVTVGKKALTVTAETKNKVEGEADPALTYKADGLVGSDVLTGSLSRSPGETPGTYTITQGTLSASQNYELKYMAATLTITEKPTDIFGNPIVPEAEKEQQILAQKNDRDPDGSTFSFLQAKQKKAGETSITLTWQRVPGAKSYTVYGNKSGKKNRYQKLTTVTGTTFTQKKLKNGTYHKYVIVAVGDGQALATSKTIHVATAGGKVGNDKAVEVKNLKGSLKLTPKKTFKIKASSVAQSAKLKVKKHRKLAFETSDPKVATVTKKGVIKAVAKGNCTVYVYAQNCMSKAIKVMVK